MIAETAPSALPRRRRRWPARIAGLSALVLAAAIVVFGMGFLSFAERVAKDNGSDARVADGIVALTGGAERLTDALELLRNGRGGRLLITGVNPETSADELEKEVPRLAELSACCIDIDRRAATTVGNAVETRRWVENRGFHSLIVVTSGYHMPRALKELERALPNVALIPHPVVTEELREGVWWRDPASVRLIFSEYLKYLLVAAKLRLAPNSNDFTSAGYAARL